MNEERATDVGRGRRSGVPSREYIVERADTGGPEE
jgi:hypothetical protein